MSGHRSWSGLHEQLERRWADRCGTEPIVDPERSVEITGRWADGTVIHAPHRVRVAGVRSRGCKHAFPRLGWRSATDDFITVCLWVGCSAGAEDEETTSC